MGLGRSIVSMPWRAQTKPSFLIWDRKGRRPGPYFRSISSVHQPTQHQNNLGRQSQMVIECVQRPQVVGGQLFAQPPLHLVAQGWKGGCIFFQGGGNIL